MWSSAAAAYDALSPRMQEFLDGLTARHDAGERFWFEMRRTLGPGAEPSSAREHFQGNSHPVVCAHPVTGRRLLFVNPGYTVAINELSTRESDGLLRMLFDHLNNPAFHFRHRWQDSDVVIWDEHLTAHMGPFDFAPAPPAARPRDRREQCTDGRVGHVGVGPSRPSARACGPSRRACSACGLKRMTSASSTTRTLCPGGQ